jgi:hypothetical protein
MVGEVLVIPAKGTRVTTNVNVSGGSPTLLVAANPNRKTLVIQNQGSVTVFLGDANVGTTGADTGFALFAGTAFVDNASTTAWYAVPASSNANINLLEVS